jgi:hypothetical protein
MNPNSLVGVQEALPRLEGFEYLTELSKFTEGYLPRRPHTQEDVKSIVVDLALSLCEHEKHSVIWKNSVCLNPLAKR